MAISLSELIKEADRCVTCGLCLPHCPTYHKTGSEADSPRGRIQLMRAVAADVLPNNTRFKQHIDLCLSCRSCESACPNNVSYGALIDTSRSLFSPKKTTFSVIAKPFIRHRKLAKPLLWSLWLAQKSKIDRVFKSISPAAQYLPMLAKPTSWKALYATSAIKKGDVSLFLGCATNTLDNSTLKASIYVLNQLGYDVHVPNNQTCCGGIARQMGDAKESDKLITQNRNSFSPNTPILTTASGCGAGLQDYLDTHKILDISAFLVTCDWTSISINSMRERIYVQDPCSLKNVQKSHLTVYELLKKIPNAEIIALAGNGQCCGGAGAYMLTQSEMATRLLTDKLEAIESAQVATLATSNIGCSLHIANGLRAQNLTVKVVHPLTIIAQQMGFVA